MKKRLRLESIGAWLAVQLLASSCSIFPYGAYTNSERPLPAAAQAADAAPRTTAPAQSQPQAAAQAQVQQAGFPIRGTRQVVCKDGSRIEGPKKNRDVLVILAFSGGGSRAAYLSTRTMEHLQKLTVTVGDASSDVLHEVDVISSVSGGSVAAAFYAVTADADPRSHCPEYAGDLWNVEQPEDVRTAMLKEYRNRWIANWLWPANIVKYWFTSFNRTDIMAQTLADNLYRRPNSLFNLTMDELNPLRPNLILNATAGNFARSTEQTEGRQPTAGTIAFGDVFTFTDRDFARICSRIDDYSLGRAVMASATFPGVFNFMTLRNYCTDEGAQAGAKHYLHVFDGGNGDNLGLISAKRVIWESLQGRDSKPELPYAHVVVILVDAFVEARGASPESRDPRGVVGHFIDTNFLDATDSLLVANRERLLTDFTTKNGIFPFAPSNGKPTKECLRFFSGNELAYCDERKEGSDRGGGTAFWRLVNGTIGSKLKFVHVNFDLVEQTEGCADRTTDCLRRQLNTISTDFQLSDVVDPSTGLTADQAIACAVSAMFDAAGGAGNECRSLRPRAKPSILEDWTQVKAMLSKPRQTAGGS